MGTRPTANAVPLGPSARGRCRGGAECLPSRSGDRWVCTRDDARGGPCDDGPAPDGTCGCLLPRCSPRRSLRKRRQRVTLFTCAATIGVLMIFLGGAIERQDQFANPGSLTHAHSSDSVHCADCHGSGGRGIGGQRRMFSTDNQVTNAACLSCHPHIDPSGRLAGFAHGLMPHQLSESADRARALGLTGGGAPGVHFTSPLRSNALDGDLSCTSCHREHHGKHADLAALTDAQCQTCHLRKFKDFSHGHPSFAATRYPYSRRSRIVFDHGAHYKKHFAERPEHAPAGFDPANFGGESQSCSGLPPA